MTNSLPQQIIWGVKLASKFYTTFCELLKRRSDNVTEYLGTVVTKTLLILNRDPHLINHIKKLWAKSLPEVITKAFLGPKRNRVILMILSWTTFVYPYGYAKCLHKNWARTDEWRQYVYCCFLNFWYEKFQCGKKHIAYQNPSWLLINH